MKRAMVCLLSVMMGLPCLAWADAEAAPTHDTPAATAQAPVRLPAVNPKDAVEVSLRKELEAAQRRHGAYSAQVMEVLKRLGKHYRSFAKPNRSNPKEGAVYDYMARIRWAPREKQQRQAVADATATHGAHSPQTIAALLQLARFLRTWDKRRAELFATLDDAVKRARQQYGATAPELAEVLYQSGRMLIRLTVYPDDPERFTKQLNQRRRAETLLAESLQIYEQAGDPEPRRRADVIDRLAGLYRLLGKPQQAVAVVERGLHMDVKYQGKKAEDISQELFKLARKHRRYKRYQAALDLLQRALELDLARYGSEHRYIAVTSHELGKVYTGLAQYTSALRAYRRSLDIMQRLYPKGSVDLALALHDVGNAYEALGLYDLALPLFRRSLALYEQLLTKDDARVMNSLHNLSGLLIGMGNFPEALALGQRVLQLTRDTSRSADDPDIATAMNSLAIIHARMGTYDQSATLYQGALQICQRRKRGCLNLPTILGNYAVLLGKLGRYTEAVAMHKASLASLRKRKPVPRAKLATELSNLGALHLQMGQTRKAVPLLERGLGIRQGLLPADHPLVALSLGNLSSAYEKLGQHAKALRLRERVGDIYKRTLPDDHPRIATHLNNLAYLHLRMGKLERAEPTMLRAAVLAQSAQGDVETLWRVQSGLLRLYTKLERRDLAIFWGKEAVNTIQGLRANVAALDKASRTGFLHNKRYVYQQLADLLIAAGRLGEAQTVLQMLKEQELYDTLQRATKTDPRRTRIDLTGLERKRFARYYALQDEQAGLIKELEQLNRKAKLGDISAAEQQRLNELNDKLLPAVRDAMLVFFQTLQKESDQFAEGKAYRQNELTPTAVETNLQNILRQLKGGEPALKLAALQYVVTDTRLSILLSTPNHPPLARQVKFDGATLRNQIFTVRELLSDPESDRTILQRHLQALHAILIAPVAEDLKTLEPELLLLVPNDVLRYIPFAALHDGRRYLVEDYSLTLFNEAVKKDLRAGLAATWQVAAMGLTRAVENLPALTNVRDELQAVTVQSGLQGTMYLDDDFTKTRLTQSLQQDFNILHLASHFEFVAGRPDASRLFLGDRSSLYLGDIAREDLRFDKFSLVTFSACETGLGGGLDADGRAMDSLGALVQQQGAGAVMATLWKVEDSSTATLMGKFYRLRQKKQLAKAAALRAAQLQFIRRSGGGSVLAHPYYWAPFVLMGDWR